MSYSIAIIMAKWFKYSHVLFIHCITYWCRQVLRFFANRWNVDHTMKLKSTNQCYCTISFWRVERCKQFFDMTRHQQERFLLHDISNYRSWHVWQPFAQCSRSHLLLQKFHVFHCQHDFCIATSGERNCCIGWTLTHSIYFMFHRISPRDSFDLKTNI